MLEYDFKSTFNMSFDRAVRKDVDGFYNRFYEHFLALSPAIREVFRHTDMVRQREMLHESVLSLVAFSQHYKASRYMLKVAKAHGQQGLALPHEFYTQWMDALLQTVKDKDPEFSPQVAVAWRIAMAPGIAFMENVDQLSRVY